jgi:hypothetical protein
MKSVKARSAFSNSRAAPSRLPFKDARNSAPNLFDPAT